MRPIAHVEVTTVPILTLMVFVLLILASLSDYLSRPLLLLGGVADALTEALSVLEGGEGMGAARAAEACIDALKLLKEGIPSLEEGLSSLDEGLSALD